MVTITLAPQVVHTAVTAADGSTVFTCNPDAATPCTNKQVSLSTSSVTFNARTGTSRSPSRSPACSTASSTAG